MPEDDGITRSFGLKTLSDANTPKYAEKNKKPTQDYVRTIEGETLSSFVRGKVQNREIIKRKRKVFDCNVRFQSLRVLIQSKDA